MIHELMRRAAYRGRDYQYYFLRISNNQEIDLIVDRPGQRLAVIEIKSTSKVQRKHVRVLLDVKEDFENADFYLLSQDKDAKEFDGIKCMNWQAGIKEIINGVNKISASPDIS